MLQPLNLQFEGFLAIPIVNVSKAMVVTNTAADASSTAAAATTTVSTITTTTVRLCTLCMSRAAHSRERPANETAVQWDHSHPNVPGGG